MESWQIIVGGLAIILSIALFKYVNNTSKKQGPLLSQAYLSLSEEERQYFDKDAEYQRITILYGLLGGFFVFVSLAIFTLMKIFAFIAIGILITALIYSLIKLIELRKNSKL